MSGRTSDEYSVSDKESFDIPKQIAGIHALTVEATMPQVLNAFKPLGEDETTAVRRYISHHERLRTSSFKFAAACVKLGDR